MERTVQSERVVASDGINDNSFLSTSSSLLSSSAEVKMKNGGWYCCHRRRLPRDGDDSRGEEGIGCGHGDCEIARAETKAVRKLKILVYLVLMISALSVTLGE
jgi:hypothetical protein